MESDQDRVHCVECPAFNAVQVLVLSSKLVTPIICWMNAFGEGVEEAVISRTDDGIH